MQDEDDFTAEASPRTKAGVVVLVTLLHIIVLAGVIRAFAPDFTAQVTRTVLSAVTVTVTTPPPDPTKQPDKAGAAGEAGKKALAREVKAVKPVKKTDPAPKAASTGDADTSGAGDSGAGTGAGGAGSGTGSGTGGSGPGGGAATRAVHVSGQINNARDLPVPPQGRAARIGTATILAFTISAQGRVSACRVYKSSGFAETDQAVCRLAQQNLRFRPATNSAGEPVSSTFYWQQKYFN